MKYKIFLLYLYIYFLFKVLGKSYCKDIFKSDYENNSSDSINNCSNSYLPSDFSPLNDNNFYYINNSKFVPNQIFRSINPGVVESILLFKETVYIFNINLINHSVENDLIIYFYPLDCEIQIIGEGEDLIIEKISNYENDAFYVKIKKQNLNTTKIIMNTLINSKDEKTKNRAYHLIINSFEYNNNNTSLTIKEKEPTFLTFNNKTINKINLKYQLINDDIIKNPISISFFIKEKVKFLIKVYNNSNEIYKKAVGYLDRILIDPVLISKGSTYLNISIEKNEEKDAVMVVKVIKDYLTPIYFQKNILNIGFIPKNVSYQYFYMEVFKGEHGEIILNNKRYNGKLFSKLIQKQNATENEIFYSSKLYPNDADKEEEDKDALKYNEYSQKITINTTNTSICTDGCYLLITYYSLYLNKAKDKKILGTEFTLLGRIFEQEEEFRTQIINIPLNEYIFGSFEFSSIKIHYYSLYIPDKETNLTLEINLNYIGIFIKKGVKKININNINSLDNYFGNLIYSINPQEYDGLESFEDNYFTFAFSTYLPIENSHYYFRILQNNNNHSIYPLDTNKANICNTTKIIGDNIYSCFFLIDNIYKDLYNDIIIYAYGNKHVKYKAWFVEKNESDYYSIDLTNLNFKNRKIEDNKKYFKIDKNTYADNSEYILIKIESSEKEEETLTILTNFYDNNNFYPLLQIYSYQLIYLYDNEDVNFNFVWITQKLYRILINSTYGNGEIQFDSNSTIIDQYNRLISGDRTYSYVITKELNNIEILNNKENNLLDDNELIFNIKIVYELNSIQLEEIYFNNVYSGLKKAFPVKLFLREIEYEGSDINFKFPLDTDLTKEDLIIRGYTVKYDLMKLITEKTFIHVDFGEEIEGRFDERSKLGLIVFEKDNINHLDNYYLIEIVKANKNKNQTNITMDIYASPKKNDSQYSIPINTYISGSFNLKNSQIQQQRYFIHDVQNSSSNEYYIEFSSNYYFLDLQINRDLESEHIMTNGGIQRYYVSINKTNLSENYFEIKINNTKKEKSNNYCNKANYIIFYYQKKKDITDYKVKLHGKIRKNSPNITIENKDFNDIEGNYNITCIYNIYEKKKILKDENLNTIAPIDSESIFTKIEPFCRPYRNISFDLNDTQINKNYNGTVFVILQNNNNNLERISYYLFSFEIDEEDGDKNNYKKYIIISSISVAVIIIIIIFALSYRKVIKKNHDLEKKVNQVSFVDNNDGRTSSKDEIITIV